MAEGKTWQQECTNCGSPILFEEGQTTRKCKFCGTENKLIRGNAPSRAEDEQAMENAKWYLEHCQFSEAARAFDVRLNKNPKDGKAYWGKLMCKYGVEIKDTNGKKQTLCHRARSIPMKADALYEMACANSTPEEGIYYESIASSVDKIQKKITDLALFGETYDIFLCYKHSDPTVTGGVTEDSRIVSKIYSELQSLKYKVFFSEQTLKGCYGDDYEANIYRALKSSQVMLVFGSRAEYMEATWPMSEWSRYLEMMEREPEKRIVPVLLGNMKTSDLPQELSGYEACRYNEGFGNWEDLKNQLYKWLKKAQDDLYRLEIEKKKLEEEKQRLQAEKQLLLEQKEQLEKQTEELQKQKKGLEKQQEITNQALQKEKEKNQELEQAKVKLEKAQTDLREANKALEDNLKKNADKEGQLKYEIERLEQQLGSASAEAKAKEKQLKEAEERLHKAVDELSSEEAAKRQAEVEKLRAELNGMLTESERKAREEISEKQDALNQLNREKRAAEDKVHEMEQQLKTASGTMGRVQNELDKAKAENEKHAAALKKAKEDFEKLEKENDELAKLIDNGGQRFVYQEVQLSRMSESGVCVKNDCGTLARLTELKKGEYYTASISIHNNMESTQMTLRCEDRTSGVSEVIRNIELPSDKRTLVCAAMKLGEGRHEIRWYEADQDVEVARRELVVEDEVVQKKPFPWAALICLILAAVSFFLLEMYSHQRISAELSELLPTLKKVVPAALGVLGVIMFFVSPGKKKK